MIPYYVEVEVSVFNRTARRWFRTVVLQQFFASDALHAMEQAEKQVSRSAVVLSAFPA